MNQHKEQQGFVTFAQNTAETDYLRLAYLQALNVKATQRENKYAVIVDKETAALITDKHRRVFDYVIELPVDYSKEDVQRSTRPAKKFDNEWQVFWLTPFKETIKLESDLLFTRSIDHWWTAFRLKNIALSLGARTYADVAFRIGKYRELWDANDLPDVYNGLMYFRYSQESADFFSVASKVWHAWHQVEKLLNKYVEREEKPSTDVLYAITAKVMGGETCTLPSMDFINFVHMKSGAQGWSDTRSWLDTVMNERDGDVIRINNLNQYHPVHYYEKSYATDELIEYYEQRVLG